jgi:hypothetical protein
MGKFGRSGCWIFIVIVFISIASAHDGISSTSELNKVQLSDTEAGYLNERLQTKEHMSLDDALNTIIELEHFYTLLKNTDIMYPPSSMVDKAWHQHILHTTMYNNFSREHFGIEFLHHLPFWSGNMEEVEKMQGTDGELGPAATYNILVSMFGLKNVNATVWLMDEDEPHRPLSNTMEHIEI